ncbi:MAG: DUF1573 domain-containing protein [Cyclobacteriaceae bacterium]|nr:DUF1573 domain-containing protein [Cyclobacteriaceae bacterium]
MKSVITKLVVLVVLVVGFTACSNKESEKKIAALENRIKELEGGEAPTKTAVTPAKEPDVKPEGPIPSFEWETTEHDFGKLNEGDVVTYSYKFKNTGEAPLIIEGVRPSCGCTAPNWTKTPIPVGGEGVVDVKFDSKGKHNAQNKTVTVTANTWPKQTVLRFKTFVTPKDASK